MSLQVDAQLQPSRWAQYSAGLWLLLGVLLCGVTPLPLWWRLSVLGLLLLGGACWWYGRQQQPQLAALYQRDDGGWQWQQHGHTRWEQGCLLACQGFGLGVVLHLDCAARQRKVVWLIWRDQVDAANWRRLQVVQRWHATQHTTLG